MNYQVNQELQLTSADGTQAGVYRVKKVHPLSLTLECIAGMQVLATGKPVSKDKVTARMWKP